MQPSRADMDVLANSLCRSDSPRVIIHSLTHTLFFYFFSFLCEYERPGASAARKVVSCEPGITRLVLVPFFLYNKILSCLMSLTIPNGPIVVFPSSRWVPLYEPCPTQGFFLFKVTFCSLLGWTTATWGTTFWTPVKHCFWTEQQQKTEIIKQTL